MLILLYFFKYNIFIAGLLLVTEHFGTVIGCYCFYLFYTTAIFSWKWARVYFVSDPCIYHRHLLNFDLIGCVA